MGSYGILLIEVGGLKGSMVFLSQYFWAKTGILCDSARIAFALCTRQRRYVATLNTPHRRQTTHTVQNLVYKIDGLILPLQFACSVVLELKKHGGVSSCKFTSSSICNQNFNSNDKSNDICSIIILLYLKRDRDKIDLLFFKSNMPYQNILKCL